MQQQTKLRWGEVDEDEDLDFLLLPPKQVIGPDDNGVKKVIEYKFNDEGNKVKVTTTTKVRKLAKAHLSKKAVERRSWPKFGDAVHEEVGARLTMVRSLTLDVRVWEPSVISLFQSLGNVYANSVWEEFLHARNYFKQMNDRFPKSEQHKPAFMKKPTPSDPVAVKELFIHAKYEENHTAFFVRKAKGNQNAFSMPQQMWESVRANNKQAVYHLIVCSEADVNAMHRQPSFAKSFIMPRARNSDETPLIRDADRCRAKSVDRTASRSLSSLIKGKNASRDNSLDGCSILHLACQFVDVGMVELLLQHGSNINVVDSRGRTPLHHCISEWKTDIAKVLLMRGASGRAVDNIGESAMQLALDLKINDADLRALLTDNNR